MCRWSVREGSWRLTRPRKRSVLFVILEMGLTNRRSKRRERISRPQMRCRDDDPSKHNLRWNSAFLWSTRQMLTLKEHRTLESRWLRYLFACIIQSIFQRIRFPFIDLHRFGRDIIRCSLSSNTFDLAFELVSRPLTASVILTNLKIERQSQVY